MNVITLRDYAKQNNISYEAVRKQVVRYTAELEGHLIKEGRQQFLDEEAVAFLDAKRQKNPVAIIQQSKDETIEALQEQIVLLQAKVTEQAEKLATQAEELRVSDKALADVNVLLLNAAKDKERLNDLEAQNANLSTEKNEAKQKEAEALKTAEKANMELECEREYAQALEEWTNLPWLKRMRTSKPVRNKKE